METKKSEAVEQIVEIFQAQAERVTMLSERVDMLLENDKTSSECIKLMALRIIALEKQLLTIVKFIVNVATDTTDQKDVH